jgi:hypothetical protein
MSSDHGFLRDISGAAYGSEAARDAIASENDMTMVTNKGELAAYKSEKGKKIYVSHRGTKRGRDLSADAAIMFGMEKYHPRFKRAEKRVKRIREENPDYEIVHTGHSLGGSLAQYTGKKSGKDSEVVTFNKGAGAGSLFRKRGRGQTDYVNVYDPVSMLSLRQKGGNVKKQKKITGHAHKLESSTSQRIR